jgi:hypothetical protein
MKVLVIHIGGAHVNILATGQKQSRKLPSGPKMTPRKMVAGVKKLAKDIIEASARDPKARSLAAFRLGCGA